MRERAAEALNSHLVNSVLFVYIGLWLLITATGFGRWRAGGGSEPWGEAVCTLVLVAAALLRRRLTVTTRVRLVQLLPFGAAMLSIEEMGPATMLYPLLAVSGVALTALVQGGRLAAIHTVMVVLGSICVAWRLQEDPSARAVVADPATSAAMVLVALGSVLATVLPVLHLRDHLTQAYDRLAIEIQQQEAAVKDAHLSLAALRASEGRAARGARQLHNLLAAIPDSITRMDPDGRFTALHAPARSPFLTASGSILLQEAGFPEDTADRVKSVIAPEASPDRSFLTESSIDGEERWWEVRAIQDSQDWLLVFHEVTGQRRVSNQLAELQKMESLGHLAGGIAHDFGNMLTGILAFSEVLSIRLTDRPDLLSFANQIMQAARRAAELTRKLRAFSRRGVAEPRSVDINKVAEEAVGLLQQSVNASLQLVLKTGAEHAIVRGEPGLLVNAVLNLGINARDAMPDGGLLTVTTSAAELDAAACATLGGGLRPGPHVLVAVADTGTGITPELRERIFEPFFSTKAATAGTGLGLAIVYGTVRDHRGTIRVESNPGRGSIFTIYLPVVVGVPAFRPIDHEPRPGKVGRVLLVDDEPLARAATRAQLEGLGWQVQVAADGASALEQWAAGRSTISVIILDVIMPGIDGRLVARQILEQDPGARIILHSGYMPEGEVVPGIVAVLQKPTTRVELAEALDLAMHRPDP